MINFEEKMIGERTFKKKVKEILTALKLYKPGSEKSKDLLNDVIVSPYNGVKLKSLLKLIRNHLPEIIWAQIFGKPIGKLTGFPNLLSKFHISGEMYKSGYENLVFIVIKRSDGKKMILKIDYLNRSFDLNTNGIYEYTQAQTFQYMEIRSIFEDIPNVHIPEMFNFVDKSPVDDKLTKFTLMEFIDSDDGLMDIFDEKNREQMLKIFENSPQIKESLKEIMKKLRRLESEKKLVDVLGEGNMVIRKINGRYEIVFIDCLKYVPNVESSVVTYNNKFTYLEKLLES